MTVTMVARTKVRVWLSLAMIAVGAGLIGAAVAYGDSSAGAVRQGGMFRVVMKSGGLDFVDPALSTGPGWALLDATCAKLMNFADKPGRAGTRLVPEVAAGDPRVSRDGKTYTFTLRRSFRFSNKRPVRPLAFAWEIARVLALGDSTYGAGFVSDIVGAEDVRPGQPRVPSGVATRGNRLIVHLKSPSPDFPARTAMPYFCAVPPNLPSDPEGRAAFPGSGPYYVAKFVRGRRVVIRRNRYYRGSRQHHVDGFVVADAPDDGAVLDRVDSGRADYAMPEAPAPYFPQGLDKKYGVHGPRLTVVPGLGLVYYALNLSRPLFRNNLPLRRAVNFAVDRAAIRGMLGGRYSSTLTDQFLPPGLAGFRDARVYRRSLSTARRLASGHRRGGKAILYTQDVVPLKAAAQVVKRNLARIGIDVELKGLPFGAYRRILADPREPWDIAFTGWFPDYVDPFQYLNVLFDSSFVGVSNFSRFSSPKYDRLLRHAARLRGTARSRAYGRLDVQITRDVAPLVPIGILNATTFVSKRVDPRCIVLRPELDLAAVCLKR